MGIGIIVRLIIAPIVLKRLLKRKRRESRMRKVREIDYRKAVRMTSPKDRTIVHHASGFCSPKDQVFALNWKVIIELVSLPKLMFCILLHELCHLCCETEEENKILDRNDLILYKIACEMLQDL